MGAFEAVPLFSRLSRLERARLIPEIKEIVLAPGESLPPAESNERYLYIIQEGSLLLTVTQDEQDLHLLTLCPHEMVGEESVLGQDRDYSVRTQEGARLTALPASKVRALLRSHPTLVEDLAKSVVGRERAMARELARVRLGLLVYSRELWGVLDEEVAASQVRSVAAAGPDIAAAPAGLPALRESVSIPVDWRRLAGFALSVLVGMASYLISREYGFTYSGAVTLGVLAWSVVNWTFDTMPDYVTAVAAIGLAAALHAVPVSVALSGFANPTWVLSLSVLGLGAVIARSGLLFRIALKMLGLLPPTYLGQTFALATAGLLLTPVLPSPSGRLAIASPLAMELAEAMRLPDRSRGAAGLGMSVLLGFGQMYFMFLNGTGTCILLWSLLPDPERARVSWGFWLMAALPLGLVVFGLSFLLLQLMLRPDQRVVVKPEILRAQLQTLGAISVTEWTTLVIVSSVLAAFITQPWHGVDPAWIALSGLLLLLGLGMLDRESFRRQIDWNFLMLYGGLIGVAAIMQESGLSEAIRGELLRFFRPFLDYPVLFLTLVAAVTTLLRVAVPMVATALLMAVVLYPLAPEAGVSTFTLTLAIQVASNPWFLPHQNTFYQTTVAGTDGRSFTHGQVRPYAFLYALLTILSVPAAYPFWRWLGLVP